MWNFHVYDLQVNHSQVMILGRYILSEINIDLCFSDNNIRVNGGVYKGCTTPMKYFPKSISIFNLMGLKAKASVKITLGE